MNNSVNVISRVFNKWRCSITVSLLLGKDGFKMRPSFRKENSYESGTELS